jgi:putative PEP-CTERM system histidine kinase
MLINLFVLLNFSLLAVSFFAMRAQETSRKFSLAIVQVLLFLPLLITEYLAIILNFIPAPEGVAVFFVSQSLFMVIWSTVAYRVRDTMFAGHLESTSLLHGIHVAVVLLILAAALFQVIRPGFSINQEEIRVSQFGSLYLASLLSIAVMLFMAWQLEAFWRQLPKSRSREYELVVVGGLIVSVVQGGVASYLVTYLKVTQDILFLQAAFLLVVWVLLLVGVLRYRLLGRKLFVSRKIVYSFVTPSLFSIYFLLLGATSLIVRLYDYPFKLVLLWFFFGIGAVGLALLAVSGSIRQRLRFFISTHFYAEKYEYRDEWLAFSKLLQNANTEAQVLDTLHQVLLETLYTKEIWIWAGSEADGFELVVADSVADKESCRLPGNDPVLCHLRLQSHLDLASSTETESNRFIACIASLPPPRPILFTPLIADGQLVGCIALGPEYTGGRYGQDDFDLLTAIGSQAASALITVRLTEKTACLRERRAMHNISAFLLHDVKNAASILSLVYVNAQEHMEDPEFRKDMLTAIGDALQRMDKVQASLGMLRDRVESVWQEVALCHFLEELLVRFGRRLPGLVISLDCPQEITLRTDAHLLETVFENLFLNAYEAGNGSCQVQIAVILTDESIVITVANNGPCIPEHLLPDQLFQRFVSDKPGGSGIGLWQARLVLQRLGATIAADNPVAGGARFIIHLPPPGSSSVAVGESDRV